MRKMLCLVTVVVMSGCSLNEVASTSVTLRVWRDDWSRQDVYELTPGGSMLFTSVLKSKPDTDIRAAAGLDPSGTIVLNGKDYAIEPDEILYVGSNRTKIWKRIGIRKRLIQRGRRLEEQPNKAIDSDKK